MAIPKNAKLVFKGVLFDVYQWKQKMFDGSYQTFEAIRRPYTVQVLATIGRNVLVTEERQPGNAKVRNGFLGGRIEPGETALNAAKRELLEEAGLSSDNWKLIIIEEPNSNKIDWKIYFYVARNCKKVSEPHLDAGERIKVRALSYSEFIKLLQKYGKYLSTDLQILSYETKKATDFKKLLFG
jgi:ADP-ribose pyrophosphatase